MVDIHYEIKLVAEEDSDDAFEAVEGRAAEIISGLDDIDQDTHFESVVNAGLLSADVPYQVAEIETILAPERTSHSSPSDAARKSFVLAIFISLLSSIAWL